MPGVIDVVQIPDGVAVVADTYWHAKKAREALKVVSGTKAPAPTLNDKAMLAGTAPAAGTDKPLPLKTVGDADARDQAREAKVVRAEYICRCLSHSPLEPMNFTASYHGGKIDLIGPTQWQDAAQARSPRRSASSRGRLAADHLPRRRLRPAHRHRLHHPGGADHARRCGKPVKLLWTREDDMTHDFYRPLSVHQHRGRGRRRRQADGDDLPLHVAVGHRPRVRPAAEVQDPLMTEAAIAAYEIPATRHDMVKHDAGLRVGYWRSVSHVLNAFANESFIDELRRGGQGQDPYAYRMSLLSKQPRFAERAQAWPPTRPAGARRRRRAARAASR